MCICGKSRLWVSLVGVQHQVLQKLLKVIDFSLKLGLKYVDGELRTI